MSWNLATVVHMAAQRAPRILSHMPRAPLVARPLRRYSEVIRSPRFFPLWLSQLISNFGDTIHYVALVVLVFQLTGRGVAVAILVVSEVIPSLLIGPFAGVIIDRLNRKAVLILADLVRAALALSLVWPQNVYHVYLVAAGLSAGSVFFNPTVQAVIPELTTESQRLAANSVSWSAGRLVQIVGAATAGGLIAAVGTRYAFAVNATTFVASAVLITRLRIPPVIARATAAPGSKIAGFWRDVADGLRFALGSRFLSRLLLVQALASFAVGATGALLVVLAQEHLGLSASGFAWLIGAIGAGALVGPLIPNALARDYRSARWLFVPYLVRGAGDVLIAVFASLPIALAIMFVYGLNTSTGMVTFNSALQGIIPSEFRGRVFALLDVSWSAMRLISLALGAWAADVVGIRAVFWIGGGLLALAGATGLALIRDSDLRDDQDPTLSAP